ncbi:MAG: NUDIX domain-containing protein [Spirochaetes bacterium]|nr:NUDIX domain-containing protein [Spirochaetota bacterium]
MKEPKYCPHCGRELVERDIDGRRRLTCPESEDNYTNWENPLPVVAALIEHEGRVILARNREWPEKVFGLVTGFLEKGESPEEGVLREVHEELGLHGTIRSLIGLYSYPQMNQLLIVYEIAAAGAISISDELAEVRHVDPMRLRPWSFGTGLAVRDWLIRRGIAV